MKTDKEILLNGYHDEVDKIIMSIKFEIDKSQNPDLDIDKKQTIDKIQNHINESLEYFKKIEALKWNLNLLLKTL